MNYTEQQKTAIQLAVDSVQSKKKLTRIGGFAGTGKTTILREVFAQCPNGGIVAFAGKACDVLRRKGLPGQTIHSLIYSFDASDNRFHLKKELNAFDWIGIDEGSMVGQTLWDDVKTFNKPIIVIGDPGQLEPVADSDPHLMKNPDFVLTEIHRQAQGSPIIKLSLQIREGDEIDWGDFKADYGAMYSPEDLLWPDMFVCGMNKTRLALNTEIRKVKKYTEILNEGERIICKNNDRELGVFNGQMFTVIKIHWRLFVDLQTDDGQIYNHMSVSDIGFNSYSRPTWAKIRNHVGKRLIADYGNAITCHGSQGSEYDKVAYVDEQCDKWCPIRHRYTGSTRAAINLRRYGIDV